MLLKFLSDRQFWILFLVVGVLSSAVPALASSSHCDSFFAGAPRQLNYEKNPYYLDQREIDLKNDSAEEQLTSMYIKDDLPTGPRTPLTSKDFNEAKLKEIFKTSLLGSETFEHTFRKRRAEKNFDQAWSLILYIMDSKHLPLDQVIELNKILREGDYDPPPGLERLKYEDFRFSEMVGESWFELSSDAPTRIRELFEMTNHHLDTRDLNAFSLAVNFYIHFIQIHPFPEANGRTARVLASIIMMKSGLPPINYNMSSRNHIAQMKLHREHDIFYSFFRDYTDGIDALK